MQTYNLRLAKNLVPCLLILLTVGCRVSKPPWQGRGHGAKVPAEDVHRIVFADKTLRKHDILRVSKVVPERLTNNKLKIYCEMVNRSRKDLTIQIQVAFKDGMDRIAESTPWETVVMSAMTGTSHSVTSMQTDVDDYLIRIRLATPARVVD